MAKTPAPSKATIKAKGKVKFHANGPIIDTTRFSPGTVPIKSGAFRHARMRTCVRVE